jgi:hypothetical protein
MGYRRNISSPLTADTGCSRLSAHLAFGAVSMRTVILVTHNPEIAAVTPRRIEIRNGKIAHQVDSKLAGLDRVSKVPTEGQAS